MDTAVASLVAFLFLVIAINFFMLFARLRRDKSRPSSRKPVPSEAEDVIRRDRAIQRRLAREQEQLAYAADMKDKTFELYDQVRRKYGDDERDSN